MGAKKIIQKRPSVFDYHDYRVFLKDWLNYQKSKRFDFSMRRFAMQADLSVSYLSMAINGKRSLNLKTLRRLEPFLNLRENEFSYLLCLQTLSDSESQESRLKAINKMQTFSKYKSNHSEEVRFYTYLSRWFHVAIKEMSEMEGFSLNFKWIQKRLIGKISKSDLRKAIKFLTKEGFLVPDGQGGFKAGEQKIKCEGSIFKSGLSTFHKQMFEKAIESIDVTPANKRWIYGNTLALSRKQYLEVVEVMKAANEKINEIYTKPTNEEKTVCHTGFVAFPVTKSAEEI